MTAGHEPHRCIGVSSESCLEKWSIESSDKCGDTRVDSDPSGKAEKGLIAGRLRALRRWCVGGHWFVCAMVGFLHALHDSNARITACILQHPGF